MADACGNAPDDVAKNILIHQQDSMTDISLNVTKYYVSGKSVICNTMGTLGLFVLHST